MGRTCPAVYATLNPVKPDLLARASNRLKPYTQTTTSNPDILHRVWLPLDFDPVRAAGISSTNDEHEAALVRAEQVRSFLAEKGWPDPIVADSGNGAHLLYAIDLPNTDKSRELVARVWRLSTSGTPIVTFRWTPPAATRRAYGRCTGR